MVIIGGGDGEIYCVGLPREEDDILGTVYCFTTCPDYTNNSTGRRMVKKCVSFPSF